MEDKFTLNKKLIFLVCVITLLLSCLSITTATDTNDINTTDTTITTTTEATHTTNNVQTKEIKNNKINSDLDTSNSVTTISIGEKNTSQTTTTTNNSTKNTTSTNLANNKEITENNTRKTIAKNSATAVKEAPIEVTVNNFAGLNTALRNNEGDFIINMEPGIYTSTNSIPLKASSVTIRGNGAIITSTHTNRIFISYSGSDIVLKTAFNISDLTFQNINKAGSTSSAGAAIIMGAGSNLTFTNVNFTNISSYWGGAIYVNGRTNVSFTNVIFNNVSSTKQGGAICLVQANTTFNNVTFNNTYTKGGDTESNGGAVRIMTSNNVTFNNVIFNNTYAENHGGAIEVQTSGCNVYIYNTTFNNCSTNTDGGLIWAQSGNVTADNITVTNVTANDKGGAIYLYDGYAKMIVSNSTFINSNATNAGGLAYVWRSSNLKIINSSIENTTSDMGGFAVNYGTLNITDSNLTHINSTTSGGLLYNNNTTYIDGSKINNIESGIGGMVYHNASTNNGLLLINNSNISNIKSDTLGGLVYSLGNVNISNSNIDHVNATGDGGVLYLNGSSKRINLTNTNVTNVFSNSNGGFAYLNYTYTYLNITDSEIINSTAVSGGLVYSKGNVNISNSNIDHVNSTGDGGVLYLNGTNQNTYVINTNVTNVFSNSNGSFVYVAISTTNRNNINITGSRIVNASATNGGALYLTGSSKTNISFSSFENMNALANGSMIYHETADDNTFNGSLSIDSSNMSYSSAGQYGGLVFSRGIMSISNSNIDHVNATDNGGVLHLARKLCRTNVTNTNVSNVFSGNRGGFAWVSSYTTNILNVTGCRIINSSAYEGGVFHIEGELNLKSTYIENTNASYGGVMRNQQDSYWDNVTVINSSATDGGVIYNKGYYVLVNNSVIKDVHATGSGGTIWNDYNANISNTNITNSSASIGGCVYTYHRYSRNKMQFIGNILQDSYVTDDEHFVIELDLIQLTNTPYPLSVNNNLFINNTDNKRDMLLQRENTSSILVSNNTYIDNFLEDSIVDVEDVTVTGEDKELQIKINLREVYNNTIVNGTFEVYDQDEKLITTADVVNGLSDVIIPVDGLKSGQNDLTVKYVSLSKHYQPAETSLTVFKLLDTSITIEAPETLKVSEKTTINITLKDENGNNLSVQIIKVKIGDTEEEYTTDENGTVSIPDVSYSEIGEKPITAVFDGTTEYVNSDLTISIQVEQLETKINVTADTPIKFGTSTVINGTLIDEFDNELGEKLVNIKIVDADGNVIVDENVPTSDTGFYEFEFTNGAVGTCNVTVSYKGETNYEECNATYQVIVDKVETFINVTANDVKVGEETTITGTLVDEWDHPLKDVEVIIAIDGNTIGTTTTSSDGIYTIKYNATSSGVKTITVKTADNSTNIGANNSTTFNVDKNPVTITVETSDVTVRNTTNITGTVSNATGTLSDVEVVLYVNGVEINKTRTNSTGGYNFAYDTFITGVNNVTVRYNGNDYYDYYEANDTFNVIKRNTTITVDDIANVTVGNNVTITGVLKDQFGEVIPNAIVTVNVNDILYTKITNSAGEYTVVYPTSLIGANTVTVTYNANDTFNDSSSTLIFNVTKHEVNIESEFLQIKPGTSLIEVNVTDETNKNVIYGNIVIKDEEGNIVGSATVINGTVKTVVNTVPGEHTYTIEFTGTDEYEDATATITEDIPKYDTTIIPGVIGSTKINDTIVINGTLIDQYNNPVGPTKINITINNENVTVDVDEDGIFTYTNTTNVTGTTNITINYPGDENNSNSSISYNFTVNPLTTQLAVNATSPVVITNTSVIAGELKDENDQPIIGDVEIWVNDELITTVSTDQDGKFNYSLITDVLGLNNVTVKYDGASDYYAVNASTNFFVDQMFTALNVSAVSPVKVGSNTTISGRLVDGRGNPISGAVINITVGESDKYNVTTDPDGYYTLNVTGENAGDYKVKVYYNGTVAFLESNNTAKFIVEKHDVDINVEIEELKAGNTTLNITLTDEDGNLIADQEFNITDSSGNVIGTGKTNENGNLITNITVEPGKQQVTIVSEGTDNYLPENKTITLTVPEYETELEVNDVEDTEIGESTTITGTLKDAEGKSIPNANVTIKVDGETFEVPTDNNGNYQFEYNATSAGEKEVVIEFTDKTGKYENISDTRQFNVNSIDSKVNVDTIEDTKVGHNVTINGTLLDKNGKAIPNAEVIVSVNGVNHTVTTDENGTYSLVYVPSTVGTNNVSIIYEGDNDFNNNTSNTTFTVAPIGTSITSKEKQHSNGVTVVELTVTDEDNNNIPYGPVYIEDENGNIVANGSIINGTLTTTIPTQPGENNFKLVFNGTDKLANSTKDITINVPKYDSTIIPDPIAAIKVGEETNISGTIVDEFNNPVSGQKVNITVNGENYTVTTNPDGTYNLPFTADTSGENNITVTLIGDDDYSTQNVSYNNVNVDKLATTATVTTPTTVKAGTPATITGEVLDENNKPLSNAQITVKVGNETINTTTDKDGKYTVTTTPETTGKLPVTVNYDGDNTHKATNNTGILLVDKLDTILTANVDNPVKLGSTESITGTLLDENNNAIPDADVTVTVNGKAITTKTDSNGEYSIDYPTTTTGVNNVTVDYLGDDEHYPISTNRKFTVEELDVVVDVAMPNVEAGSSNLVANITDENGNKVSEGTVTITTPDGKQINATVKDGKVNVTVPTTPGQQTYTITYNGNDDYEPSTKTVKVDVPKVNTTLNVDSLTPSEVDDTTAVKGILKDSNGNPVPNAEVTVTYANTTQTVKTDSEGKFTANIPEVRAGTNNVTVTYTGNDNYNPASNNTKQTVNKHSTIVTVDEVIGIIGEKITLTAHVTDANGNKVSGGNLVFKLNGKTLREDYRFDSNASALKFKVVDGKVTVTITADLYLRNVKNLTASYSGSYKYEANVSDVVTAQIQKRRAILNVTTVPTTVKQDKNIVFKAYLTDITTNAENKTSLSTNGTVIFKVNGNTIKDENGSQIHVDVVNNVASYVYYITPGTASVDKNGNLRNYSVEAVYDNPSFYPDTRNTTAYHVEKSSVNINIEKTTVKSNELSVKATFTDYNGNALVGENKICIKINGKTYQENGKPKYFTVQNGKVNLSGIKLEQGTKVKSVTIVTGERQSYHSARETTTDITY